MRGIGAFMFAAALVISLPLYQSSARGYGGSHGGGSHGGAFHGGGFHGGGVHFGGHFGGMRFHSHHFGYGRFYRFGHHFIVRPYVGNAFGQVGPWPHGRSGRCSTNQVYGFVRLKNGLFSRNAFGTWNGWSSRWRFSQCSWFGPVFWPYLYGDVLTFVLWPDVYSNPFWDYDVDSILGGMFWPGSDVANIGPDDIYGVEACGGLAPGVAHLAIDRMGEAIDPTGDQITSLAQLKSAVQASEILATSCASAIPITPVGRLDVVEKRVDAMIKAAEIVRSPLTNLYDSLTNEQRQRLAGALGADLVIGGKAQGARGGAAALCEWQAAEFPHLPLMDVAQEMQLTERQQAAFDRVISASSKAATELQASCPREMPQTVAGRFGAVESRLRAMLEALNAVRPALNDFYASLEDEQKSRFNTLGQPRGRSVAR